MLCIAPPRGSLIRVGTRKGVNCSEGFRCDGVGGTAVVGGRLVLCYRERKRAEGARRANAEPHKAYARRLLTFWSQPGDVFESRRSNEIRELVCMVGSV